MTDEKNKQIFLVSAFLYPILIRIGYTFDIFHFLISQCYMSPWWRDPENKQGTVSWWHLSKFKNSKTSSFSTRRSVALWFEPLGWTRAITPHLRFLKSEKVDMGFYFSRTKDRWLQFYLQYQRTSGENPPQIIFEPCSSLPLGKITRF